MRGYRYKHPIISKSAIAEIERVVEEATLSGFTGTPQGHLGFGKQVQALEDAFRDYFGVKYAVSVNSATAGLHCALVACGIGQGDEVIVTPYSFSSSASAVLMVGATPVFADINEDTFCLNPPSVWDKITDKTKAIIPVHLCGHPADLDRLLPVGSQIKIIEDAAQAIGAKYKDKFVGTIGDCGIFSFNQSKHISTGEGGMLLTNDDYIARVARAVRNHGEVADPELKILGWNYRLCEIEAVLALEQLGDLPARNAWRIQLCEYMSENLSDIEGLTPPVVKRDCTHVYYTYAVRLDSDVIKLTKNEFCEKLGGRDGIYFGTYVKPLYLLPIYEQFGYGLGLCPVAERMYLKELVVTDIFRYPMTINDAQEIASKIKKAISECQLKKLL